MSTDGRWNPVNDVPGMEIAMGSSSVRDHCVRYGNTMTLLFQPGTFDWLTGFRIDVLPVLALFHGHLENGLGSGLRSGHRF